MAIFFGELLKQNDLINDSAPMVGTTECLVGSLKDDTHFYDVCSIFSTTAQLVEFLVNCGTEDCCACFTSASALGVLNRLEDFNREGLLEPSC